MNIEIVPATHEHAVDLAPRLRADDRHEVWASGGRTPVEALLASLKASDPDMCWAATCDGKCEIMWGVARDTDHIGFVWLLGSDWIYTIKRRFWRESIRYVSRMHTRYMLLTNYVHHDNAASIRWLEIMGFEPRDRVEEFGVGKEPFIRYELCVMP